MRRPAALPRATPPAPQRDPSDAATAGAGERAERRPAPAPSHDDEFATEPLDFDGFGSASTAVREEPPGGKDPVAEEGAAEDVAETPVSALDVWRAARARRRALRSEIRRFTRSSRRRRWAWLGGIGAVVALIAGSVGVAYSPLFALERITVVGTAALDAAAVESALSGHLGTPLALIDEEGVREALTAFPLIESYAIEAKPPHEIVVRVVERTPIGVVETAAGFTLVDAAGVVLATLPGRPEGQPLLAIDGGADSAAFRAAGLVVRSMPPEMREQLVRVAASSADDVTLTLASGTAVVWGSAENSAQKAIVLERTMQAHPGAGRYDVSSPDAVVVG